MTRTPQSPESEEAQRPALADLRYVAIYRLFGVNALPENAKTLSFVEFPGSGVTATLTTDPEPYFLHIEQASAVLSQLLRGLFREDKPGTPDERVATELESIRTARREEQEKSGAKCFLVIEGAAAIPAPDFEHRRDAEAFAVCPKLFAEGSVKERFGPALQGALIALGTALPGQADARIETLGEIAYVADTDGKPIYSFRMEMGKVRPSIAGRLTNDAIDKAQGRATAFAGDRKLAKVATLLIESQEARTGELRAFIATWSALEMFVDTLFRSTFQPRWRQTLASNVPASATPYFDRVDEVMGRAHRLTDKFVVIGSILTPDTAEEDTATFRRLKKARDNLFHGTDAATQYPVEDVQSLLWRYLDLHLAEESRRRDG